jgi:hypothetical protein
MKFYFMVDHKHATYRLGRLGVLAIITPEPERSALSNQLVQHLRQQMAPGTTNRRLDGRTIIHLNSMV